MEAASSKPQQTVLLPNSDKPVSLPVGWTVDSSDPLTLIGPEGDLRLTLLVAPATAGMQHIAQHAWTHIDLLSTIPSSSKPKYPPPNAGTKSARSYTIRHPSRQKMPSRFSECSTVKFIFASYLA